MYPLIYCMLKCLTFSKLLKIANIGKKRYTKSLQFQKFAVPLLLETETKPKPKPKKLFDNIDSEKAGFDSYRFLGCMPFVLMLYKNGKKGLTLAPYKPSENKYLIIFVLWQI